MNCKSKVSEDIVQICFTRLGESHILEIVRLHRTVDAANRHKVLIELLHSAWFRRLHHPSNRNLRAYKVANCSKPEFTIIGNGKICSSYAVIPNGKSNSFPGGFL